MGEERTVTRKKNILLFAFFCRMFFSGVEYSVIFPSALPYMKNLHGSNLLMGLVVAAYPLSAMLALPLCGLAYDRTKRLKELMILLNVFQVAGNLVYSLPYSKTLPIIGRFLGGIGDGFIACATGEVTYLYAEQSRISILALMELGRVLGLVVGPTINILIGKHTYTLETWVLDFTTLPGVIMAGAWSLMMLLTLCFVENLTLDMERQKSVIESECLMCQTSSSDEEESVVSISSSQTDKHIFSTFNNYVKILATACCSIEFAVIFYVDLVLWIIQTQFEMLLPYITEFSFGWTAATTSIVYVFGGSILLVIFALMYILSARFPVHDTYLLLLALFLTQAALVLLMLEDLAVTKQNKIVVFACICVVMFAAVPFNLVCSRNLFTRMFPAENQGVIQGMYSSASRIALIGGPISVSLVFEYQRVYSTVASLGVVIAIAVLMLSVKRIKAREHANNAQLQDKQCQDTP